MKDEAPFQDFPAYERQTKKGSSKGLVVLIVIILIIAGVVGGLFFLGQNKKSQSKTSITPTQKPTVEPTATPTASASGTVTPTKKVTPTPKSSSSSTERSDLNVTVLNGSGVVGAGKKVADYLAGLGYVIGSTGNADNFGYEGIIVKVKQSKSNFQTLLKKDLASQASGSAVVVSVDDTISSDAQVIVGK